MIRYRKPLVIAGAAFACLLAALLVLPFVFKDRIVGLARAELDRSVGARITWSSAGLTFFRDFPHLTLRLEDLLATGTGAFEGDTLAAMEGFHFELDLGSVLRGLRGAGPIVVRSVRLDRPDLRLVVREDGTANWDVVPSEEAEMEVEDDPAAPADPDGQERGGGLGIELRGLEIVDGRVSFDNAVSGVSASVEGLDHTLSGNFARERLVASTRTRAERASVRFAGVPYLSDVALGFDAELDIDPTAGRVTILENELRLNALVLRVAGQVAKPDAALELDLAFDAPRTEFRQMLSLVPALYARDFEALETTGTFAIDGRVSGTYGPDVFPALALRLTVEGGGFRYPDLPHPARAISADLVIENPGGDLDRTVIDLRAFHIEIGGQPLDATAAVRTPVTDPELTASVRGTLDLDALAGTVKLGDVEELSGVLMADAAVRAHMSDLDSARYERVDAEGTVELREVTLRSPDLRQPVAVEAARIELSPAEAELSAFRAQLGSSDIQATGRLENLLGFLLRDAPLTGRGAFTSRRFVLDEWRSDDPSLAAIPVPPMLDLSLEGTVEQLELDDLRMHNARGRLTLRDERLTLEGFALETMGGRVGLDGHYETTDPAAPTFAMSLTLDSLDIASASEALLTVRTLAPVARYAQGTFSADLDLSGAFMPDLTPDFDRLDGTGSLATSQITIQDFPLLDRLSEVLRASRLDDPTFSQMRSSVRIEDGRLHVEPFDVGLGPLRLTVDGSNGIDQSLDYRLGLIAPRGQLGEAAQGVVQGLASRAGVDLAASETVRIGVRVGGTVSDPALDLGVDEAVASAGQAARQAAESAVEERVDEARERLDVAAEEARRRAEARADSLVAEAEERAEIVRAEARALADQIRAEGDRRAEEVIARATNPIARAAAEPVAARIRQEAEERADQVVREADERAEQLVEEARRRADPGGG